ncbi:hypothetical protein ASAP_2209 [Asaia bogorensis]|uniref:Uncharacterized protein n=1 Tax=Asaia bogorensis TaxID=91915 RepID=A0A060QGK8_9PROT|nr:hypothetical protein ASAP_2209 [Asaia bogorensis]
MVAEPTFSVYPDFLKTFGMTCQNPVIVLSSLQSYFVHNILWNYCLASP